MGGNEVSVGVQPQGQRGTPETEATGRMKPVNYQPIASLSCVSCDV